MSSMVDVPDGAACLFSTVDDDVKSFVSCLYCILCGDHAVLLVVRCDARFALVVRFNMSFLFGSGGGEGGGAQMGSCDHWLFLYLVFSFSFSLGID